MSQRQQLVDASLAHDAFVANRERMSALFDRTAYSHLSDVEVACAFATGGGAEHDALYCELHLRRLTPWKIVDGLEALEVTL